MYACVCVQCVLGGGDWDAGYTPTNMINNSTNVQYREILLGRELLVGASV